MTPTAHGGRPAIDPAVGWMPDDEVPERLPVLAVQPVRLTAATPPDEWQEWLNAPHTDTGNARRLVIDHGRHTRYTPGRGWFVWTGRRWASDEDGAITRLAEITANRIASAAKVKANDAQDVLTQKGESNEYEIAKAEAAAWKRNAQHVQQLRGLRAMVELAAADEQIVAPVDALDTDADALNVRNGTIDLATGWLRPHDHADLITKIAADVDHDPDARSERFERFLHDLTGGDTELAAYLQRAAGYTATGDTGEEVFFIAHGPAASGKSTFLEMLKAALGDYARTAAASAFVTRRQAGASPDLARLPGARLVACSELGPGAEFTPETIKSLTGGDRIFARALYRDGFEFTPTFKLWFASNDLPRIDHEDSGMWRRVHALPFIHSVPAGRRDPELKRHLIGDPGDQAAVLRWIVDGALAWRRDGLSPPAAVLAYTESYRRASDPVAAWLRDCCELDPDSRTSRADARSSYERWCVEEGERPLNNRAFGDGLRAHGVAETKIAGARHWKGLVLAGEVAHATSGAARAAGAGGCETSPLRAPAPGVRAYVRTREESSQVLPQQPYLPHLAGGGDR